MSSVRRRLHHSLTARDWIRYKSERHHGEKPWEYLERISKERKLTSGERRAQGTMQEALGQAKRHKSIEQAAKTQAYLEKKYPERYQQPDTKERIISKTTLSGGRVREVTTTGQEVFREEKSGKEIFRRDILTETVKLQGGRTATIGRSGQVTIRDTSGRAVESYQAAKPESSFIKAVVYAERERSISPFVKKLIKTQEQRKLIRTIEAKKAERAREKRISHFLAGTIKRQENGSGGVGRRDFLAPGEYSYSDLDFDKKEKTKKGLLRGIAKGIIKIPISYAKGAYKTFAQPPEYEGSVLGYSAISYLVRQQQKGDPDISMFAQTTAMAPVFALVPKLAFGAAVSFSGYKLFKGGKERDPIAIGEGIFIGAVATAGLAAKTVKYTKLEVPVKGGKAPISYKGVSLEAGSRGQPLVGVKNGKVTFGTAKLDLARADLSKGFIVETPAQTRIIQKSIPDLYPKVETWQFGKGLGIMRKTELTPSRFVQKRFVAETKTLSPQQVRGVIKFAREEQATVYGSFPSRAQMPKELARVPGDIDIQLKMGGQEAALKAETLVSQLRKGQGYPVRISKQSPTLIEAKIKGQWHHAVDIHSTDQALIELQSPAVAGEKIYGLRLGQKEVPIEGVKAMPLSEQGLRKGASIYTMREKGFAPAAHRMKDIPDFFATQEALIRSKRFGKAPLLKQLEELKASYPQEVFKQTGEARVELYSPAAKVKAPSPSVPVTPPPKSQSVIVKDISDMPSISDLKSISKSPSIRSISKAVSVGKSPSFSISPSRSIAPSPKPSPPPSPSPSKSISKSPSKPPSPKPSPSPKISPSPKPSPSKSPSLSPSPSPSPSPKLSPSPSPSPAPTLGLPPPSTTQYPRKRTTIPSMLKDFLKQRKVKQPKSYTPSGTSIFLEKKGKPTKAGVMTGLGARPIKKSSKKKKKKKERGKNVWF